MYERYLFTSFQIIQYGKEKEKEPNKHYFSQMMKVNSNNYKKSCWSSEPLIWYDVIKSHNPTMITP
jgi:hypothetical protein